jgi:hypothetical protein
MKETQPPKTGAALPAWLAGLAGNSTWETIGPLFVLIALAAASVAWTYMRKTPKVG